MKPSLEKQHGLALFVIFVLCLCGEFGITALTTKTQSSQRINMHLKEYFTVFMKWSIEYSLVRNREIPVDSKKLLLIAALLLVTRALDRPVLATELLRAR